MPPPSKPPIAVAVMPAPVADAPPLPDDAAAWRDYSWPPPQWLPGTRPSVAQAVARAASPYQTRLTPNMEREFRQWIDKAKVPFDAGPKSNYDMRGFFQALRAGESTAKAAIGKDGKVSFPEQWNTPYHPTFSDRSVYAVPGAPSWHGDTLVSGDGARIIADQRASEPARFGPAAEVSAIDRLPPPALPGDERFDAIDKQRAGAVVPVDADRDNHNQIDFGTHDQGGE